MDKKKTGTLIREARTKKDYTQSELGDLLGVTNKAVSRWENGESFPDVGVLENLAAVLDIRIQDIITGDTGVKEEGVVDEVLRIAVLQQKEAKRKAVRNGGMIAVILGCIISGYSGLRNGSVFFADESILVYAIFMCLSFVLMLMDCVLQGDVYKKEDRNTFGRFRKTVALLSFLWTILFTGGVFGMVCNGYVPFGMKLSSMGPFMNWHMIAVFVMNLIIDAWNVYRHEKYGEAIHWGWFVSMAAIYLAVLYGDLLHRMSDVRGAMESLVLRTLIVVIVTGVSLLIMKMRGKNLRNQ